MSRDISCKYAGPWGDWSGYGEANRNAITALHKAGVKVATQAINYTSTEAEYGDSYDICKKLENNPVRYDIKVLHVPCDGYLKYLEPVKYHIGHLFWETSWLSKTWVWNCNLMDEIWTGGEWHKKNFIEAGVKVPIYVFPQAINIEVRKSSPLRILGKKGFVFYSIFEWIERKNPKALLNAYWDEFQGVDDVTLLLKVYKVGASEQAKVDIKKDIQDWKRESGHREFPEVLLCFDLLSSDDMMRLHQAGDCFVSAHRGEGWGIPQAEAAVVGNPVISTNLGGIHEWFEDGKTALLTKWTETNVFNMDFAPWYEKNQKWAEVSQGDLRGKMRWVYDNRNKAKEIGRAGQEMIKEKLNYSTVGNLMRRRLEEIQEAIK